MNKRIVVTGIGIVGPFGIGNDCFWQGVTGGGDFFHPATRYESPGLAGEVPDFSLKEFVKDPKLMRLPLISQYAIASAISAILDAGVEFKKMETEKIAVIFGTCNGPSRATERICTSLIERGKKSVDPLLFQESVFNAPASLISIFFGIKGPCLALPLGLAAGGYAMATAISYLLNYEIDCALVVASDGLSEAAHKAFSYLRVISPDDGGKEGMRPFDKTRNGVVLSEGAVTMVLETSTSALERGAKIYGEVLGCGLAGDGYRIADNNPDGSGLYRAMKNAISQAMISPDNIDYIVALSLSIKKIDAMETRAIKRIFGKRAYNIPVSSIKSSIGETLGPGALFNVAAGLFAIREGIIPPTINYRFLDEECDLDIVPNHARKMEVNTVLTNSFSWGGIYNSVIVRRFE